MLPKASVFPLTLCLASGLVLSAEGATIYQGLASNDQADLSTFVELVKEVFSDEDLRTILDGENHITVFAPTNDAFAELFDALSEDDLAALHDLNSGRLERLLRYHLTRGKWRGKTGALRMLDDNVAHTYREGGDLKIDEATIVDQARYENGTVASIDIVISPADAPLPVGCGIVSSHANNLNFEGAASVSGTFGAHSVTNCQPYGPVSIGGTTLTINGGRHDSSGPRNFFMNGLSNSNVTATETGGAATPSDLNFAQIMTTFTATVHETTFTCANVRFGQGSEGGGDNGNNWWVGQEGSTGGDGAWDPLMLDCVSVPAGCNLCFTNYDPNGKPTADAFQLNNTCVTACDD